MALVEDPTALPAQEWDALLARSAQPTPFMRHAYLAAMHASHSAVAASGWQPRWLLLRDSQGALVAAAPLYLKAHSYGEYVFDWAWAEAYQRHGLPYYPKLLLAPPFTPVPGTRLLARDAAARAALVRAITALAQEEGLSSAHALFLSAEDRAAFAEAGWMLREGVQFHWQQDAAQPVASFDELLARMARHKRKNIVQERRKVAEAGVHFSVHEGRHITPELWQFFYLCHRLTYQAHGQRQPYLSAEFFEAMAQQMPEHWLMCVAHRAGQPIACSLIAIDRTQGLAWGRYWGCTEHVSCLHFEACYYQPLAWCIEQGFQRFEGGAQGEHKMARGLLPVGTASAHWLADARFARAVEDFLQRERAGVAEYVDELREHTPFKR
jgi:predicted N-acyltransferase